MQMDSSAFDCALVRYSFFPTRWVLCAEMELPMAASNVRSARVPIPSDQTQILARWSAHHARCAENNARCSFAEQNEAA